MRQMKDSGIEWIGQIPQEWEIQRGKYVFSVLSGFAFSSSDFSTHEGIPLIRIRDITSGETETFYKGVYSDEFLVNNGDLLIGMDGDFGIRIWDNGLALLNQRCCKIIAKEKSFLNFLYYVLPYELKQINDLAFFTTVKHLSSEDLALVNIPLPSEDEQLQIVDYLDTKCTQIDALIEAKEKTNALLRERRQSIIYEAVTKGLNPGAPLKDSDIEWIGMIPEDWGTRKIKYCFEVYAGATPKSGNSEFWDGDIIWVTPADYTTEQKYISAGRKNITQEGFESCSTELIPAGSLIFSKRAPIGLVAINTVDMCTNQGCLSCVPTANNDVEYFYYAFSCFTEQFDLYGSGTTFKEISADAFMNFIIPYPAPEVQRQISDYLRGKCAEMDTLISANEATIQKLKEYRQSIIYEAVTGKIET